MKGDGTGWFMGGVVEELGGFREPPLTSRKAGDKDLPGCRHKLAHHSPHTKLAPAEGQRPPVAEATFCEFYNSSPKLYNALGNDVPIFV